MSVPSALLGTLELRTSQVFSFEHGLLGFPQARAFALVPSRLEGLFWLQSLDFEALTFLLADPFPLVDGYSLELGPQEVPWSDATDSSRFLVLAIVTLPREPGRTATANLQGPLAFDLVQRRGRQIVLQHSPFGVRHPVDLGQGGHA
ncbi:MAG TPA: flagellar assembly protein FliW [Longimicrobiales bacterium]|nr:flagellar assembly protein FliW [Longimicrobiales bacterium]